MTPLSSLHPGAEILGTALENLKSGRAMRYAPAGWLALAGALLIFLIYLGFKRNIDARLTGGVLAAATCALLFASRRVQTRRPAAYQDIRWRAMH